MGKLDSNINLVSEPIIDLNTLENLKTFEVVYDESGDTFFARPRTPRPATSFDWEGELWIRIDPETREIVGLEIEDFESIFLKKYPEIAKAWFEVKSLCLHKKINRYDDESYKSFLKIIYSFFYDFINRKPTQLDFSCA